MKKKTKRNDTVLEDLHIDRFKYGEKERKQQH